MFKSKETHPQHWSEEGEYYPARHHDMYGLALAVGGTVKHEGGRERVSIPFKTDLFEDPGRQYEISIFSNRYSYESNEWNTYSILFMYESSSMMMVALHVDQYSKMLFQGVCRVLKCGHPNRDIEAIARKLRKRMLKCIKSNKLKNRLLTGTVRKIDEVSPAESDATEPPRSPKKQKVEETPASPPPAPSSMDGVCSK